MTAPRLPASRSVAPDGDVAAAMGARILGPAGR